MSVRVRISEGDGSGRMAAAPLPAVGAGYLGVSRLADPDVNAWLDREGLRRWFRAAQAHAASGGDLRKIAPIREDLLPEVAELRQMMLDLIRAPPNQETGGRSASVALAGERGDAIPITDPAPVLKLQPAGIDAPVYGGREEGNITGSDPVQARHCLCRSPIPDSLLPSSRGRRIPQR